MRRVVVVDYGIGNLYSITAALAYLGLHPTVDTDGNTLKGGDAVVIPGVARFGSAMGALHTRGQAGRLVEAYGEGRLLVGLCLGAQLLLESSEESPGEPGLGLIGGTVRKLKPRDAVVPNQGWHRVARGEPPGPGYVDEALWSDRYFYFSHSYRIELSNPLAQTGRITYGGESVTALYETGNVVGMQFHPELSGEAGLELLRGLLQGGRL